MKVSCRREETKIKQVHTNRWIEATEKWKATKRDSWTQARQALSARNAGLTCKCAPRNSATRWAWGVDTCIGAACAALAAGGIAALKRMCHCGQVALYLWDVAAGRKRADTLTSQKRLAAPPLPLASQCRKQWHRTSRCLPLEASSNHRAIRYNSRTTTRVSPVLNDHVSNKSKEPLSILGPKTAGTVSYRSWARS